MAEEVVGSISTKEHKFTRKQLAESKIFRDYKDLIYALTGEGEELEIGEMKKRIANELKRKVK